MSDTPTSRDADMTDPTAEDPVPAGSAPGAAPVRTPHIAMLDATLSRLIAESAAGHVAPAPGVGAATSAVAAGAADGAGASGFVTIDAVSKDGDGAALLLALQALGLQDGASYGGDASGRIAVSNLAGLVGVPNLRFASSALSETSGAIPAEAAIALSEQDAGTTFGSTGNQTILSRFGVDGTGVTVGILSDSFDTHADKDKTGATDTMATDIADGYLPAGTTDVSDFVGGEDEGRGMAQLVHQVAPGASILFETAENGEAAFAQNIIDLARRGAKVIVDDVSYYDEPAFQQGIVAQAVNYVEQAYGVTYLSAAANDGLVGVVQDKTGAHLSGTTGYEGAWNPGASFTYGGKSYTADAFASGSTPLADSLLPVYLTAGEVVSLKWNQPDAAASPGVGATGDLDFFITDASGNVVSGAAATDDNVGGSPVELLGVPKTGNYYIRVGLASGTEAPTEVKVNLLGNGAYNSIGAEASNTNPGTFNGHAAATGAIGVGAIDYQNTPAYGRATPTSEYYSSGGPDDVEYGDDGRRLQVTSERNVSISAPDDAATSFFGYYSSSKSDGYPHFSGTSAAAPAAAAVAALMLEENASLTPTDVAHLLQDSATPTDDYAGQAPDPLVSGAGLVHAPRALAYARASATGALTIGGAKPTAVTTVLGTHLADTITGRDGVAATLTGFGGADTFVFDAASLAAARAGTPAVSTVTDFDQGGTGAYAAGEGDTLDLSAIFSGDVPAAGTEAGFVRLAADPGNGSAALQVDTDGTGANWTTLADLTGIVIGETASAILAPGAAPVTVGFGTEPLALTGVTGTARYAMQGGPAVTLLAARPSITDETGGTTLADATVALTGNGQAQAGDVLEIAGTAFTAAPTAYTDAATGVTYSVAFDAAADTLSIGSTGTGATFADYETLLGEVQYQDGAADTGPAPHPTRTATITVDETAGAPSDGLNVASTTVLVNRAPVTGGATVVDTDVQTVAQGGKSAALANVTDPDGDTLGLTAVSTASLQGQIGSPLSGSYGALTLNADGSYSYTPDAAAVESAGPGVVQDAFQFAASDGLGGVLPDAGLDIAVGAPIGLGNASNALGYEVGGSAVALNPNLTIADPNATTVTGAVVSVPLDDYSVLTYTAPAGSAITGSYDANDDILTLSGTDTVANYQAALRSIQYTNTENFSTAEAVVTTITDALGFQATATTTAYSDATISNVSTESQLNSAISAATAADTRYIIDLNADLAGTAALTSDIATVALAGGSTLTINGNGHTIDGGGAFGGFSLASGSTQIEDLTLRGFGGIGGRGSALTVASGAVGATDGVSFAANALSGDGGAVTVEDGGSLTVGDGTLSDGGQAALGGPVSPVVFGGSGSLTLAPGAGLTLDLGDAIAQEAGNGTPPALALTGQGTVVLDQPTSFQKGISLGSGTLELAAAGAAADPIVFGTALATTLRFDEAALADGSTYYRRVANFGLDQILDFRGLRFAPGASATYAGTGLAVTSGGATDTLANLRLSAAVPAGYGFVARPDGAGGTLVSLERTLTVALDPVDGNNNPGYVDAAESGGVTLSGTSNDIGGTVSLSIGGTQVAAGIAVAQSGTWSTTVDLSSLAQGSHTLTATAQGGTSRPATASETFVLDTAAPTVASESGSPDGAVLHAGDVVTFRIAASEAVKAAGTTLALSNGGTAALSGGDGTDALTYSYKVGQKDGNTADLQATRLDGTVTDAAGNALDAGAFGAIDTHDVYDTVAPTVASEGVSPAGADLRAGGTVAFTIAASEAVTATGSTLALSNGASATLSAGNGTSTLTYTYRVGPGDGGTDDLRAERLDGTIADASGNALDDGAFAAIDSHDAVDTVAPTAPSRSLTVPQNGGPTAIGIGAPSDDMTPAGDLAIVVSGLPGDGTVTLDDGTTAVTAGESLTVAQLRGLAFTPAAGLYGQGSSFTYTVTDAAGNATTGVAALNVGGPGAPTVAGTHATATASEAPVPPFAGVTVGDPSAAAGAVDTVAIALLNGGGTLSDGAGYGGLARRPDGTYALSGTAGAGGTLTAELDALSFTPDAGAAGSSTRTTFVLTVASSSGASVVDDGTTVTDTAAAAPPPAPMPAPIPPPVPAPTPAPDAVSFDGQVSYRGGAFTLSGRASSAAGVGSVEISATLGDGSVADLGTATVDAAGNFRFSDAIGAGTQGFITATETDAAGGTASAQADYALTGGLRAGGFKAEQDLYAPGSASEVSTSLFRGDGSRRVNVDAPGQTFTSASFDTFLNGGTPGSTFVFDPGHGLDVVDLFRADGADHDTLSFRGSDFGNDVATVLSHTRDTKQGALIVDPVTGDAVRLAGVTKAELKADRGDFAFHA